MGFEVKQKRSNIVYRVKEIKYRNLDESRFIPMKKLFTIFGYSLYIDCKYHDGEVVTKETLDEAIKYLKNTDTTKEIIIHNIEA